MTTGMGMMMGMGMETVVGISGRLGYTVMTKARYQYAVESDRRRDDGSVDRANVMVRDTAA